MKKIAVLGATGSIGTQTLEVCSLQGFQVVALSAYHNISLLAEQIKQFSPEYVAVKDSQAKAVLCQLIDTTNITILCGQGALEAIASLPALDIVVNAITGIAGLKPTLAALQKGTNLAIANKETLVVAGKLIMDIATRNNCQIFPLDSEHSAIWQCLRAGKRSELQSIILTASGGPFRGKSLEELAKVTRNDALQHPTWNMGPKITIDSATLMNKGLELIEAMHLFQISAEQIDIIIHPQSVVHSAVTFVDGSMIAQMGVPDMRIPIQYALTYPDRQFFPAKPLNLVDYQSLTFYKPDYNAFPALQLALQAVRTGGFAPCILNAANEQAVAYFLSGDIKYLEIIKLVKQALACVPPKEDLSIENLLQVDKDTRDYVRKQVVSKE